MNQPPKQSPNLFNGNSSSPHPLSGLNIPDPETDESDLKQERRPVHDPRTIEIVKRFYITLIIIGIAIGGVVSIGVLAVMNHFGLTAVPGKVNNTAK